MFSGRKAELPLNVPIVCGSVRVDAGDMIIAGTTGITVAYRDQCGEGDRRAGRSNRLAGIAPISGGLLPRQVGAGPASQLKD